MASLLQAFGLFVLALFLQLGDLRADLLQLRGGSSPPRDRRRPAADRGTAAELRDQLAGLLLELLGLVVLAVLFKLLDLLAEGPQLLFHLLAIGSRAAVCPCRLIGGRRGGGRGAQHRPQCRRHERTAPRILQHTHRRLSLHQGNLGRNSGGSYNRRQCQEHRQRKMGKSQRAGRRGHATAAEGLKSRWTRRPRPDRKRPPPSDSPNRGSRRTSR